MRPFALGEKRPRNALGLVDQAAVERATEVQRIRSDAHRDVATLRHDDPATERRVRHNATAMAAIAILPLPCHSATAEARVEPRIDAEISLSLDFPPPAPAPAPAPVPAPVPAPLQNLPSSSPTTQVSPAVPLAGHRSSSATSRASSLDSAFTPVLPGTVAGAGATSMEDVPAGELSVTPSFGRRIFAAQVLMQRRNTESQLGLDLEVPASEEEGFAPRGIPGLSGMGLFARADNRFTNASLATRAAVERVTDSNSHGC